MYKNVLNQNGVGKILLLSLSLSSIKASAQLSLTGQLKTRSELRSGYGTLQPVGNSASFFTAQRTRLTFNYKSSKLIFQTSVQDVRLWGQDASTISAADGNKLGVHEAWGEVILSNKKDAAFKSSPVDYFAVKLGRQEIAYDDERLLGALDWTMQARRHDAVVFKLLQKGWQVDLGAAFNQHTDGINYNGTYYTPANVPATVKDNNGNLANTPTGFLPLVNAAGNSDKKGNPIFANPPGTNALTQNYKSFQYLYAAKKIGKTKVSGLLFADQFGKYKLDSVRNVANGNVGYIYGRRFNQSSVNTRITTGLLINPVFGKSNQWAATAGAYYQGGRDKDSLKLNAYMLTASLAYKAGVMSYTAGWDYLSGNNAFSSSKTNRRFDPLYGTPHKFWGYMDYFYAVSGAPTGGLSDPYLKVKLTSNRFTAELAGHYFMLGADHKDAGGRALNQHLGTELDLTAAYKLNNVTTVDLGLSYMAATRSMEYAKNLTPGSNNLNPVWAYLQINIKPDFLNK